MGVGGSEGEHHGVKKSFKVRQQRRGRLLPHRPELKVDAWPARVACCARPWSLHSRPTTELVLQALLTSV